MYEYVHAYCTSLRCYTQQRMRCRLQSYSLVALSLTPSPRSGVLPNRRVPSLAAVRYETVLCKDRVARKVQHAASPGSTTDVFSIMKSSKGLKHVKTWEDFQPMTSNSWGVQGNLRMARGIWARLSRTIRAENGPPPVCAAYSTKQPCNQYCCSEARHGICHQ